MPGHNLGSFVFLFISTFKTGFELIIIAGLGYEFLKFSGKYYNNRWARILIAPGLYLQKLTTQEPDDDQLEVAIAALKAVIPGEKSQDSSIESLVGVNCEI